MWPRVWGWRGQRWAPSHAAVLMSSCCLCSSPGTRPWLCPRTPRAALSLCSPVSPCIGQTKAKGGRGALGGVCFSRSTRSTRWHIGQAQDYGLVATKERAPFHDWWSRSRLSRARLKTPRGLGTVLLLLSGESSGALLSAVCTMRTVDGQVNVCGI